MLNGVYTETLHEGDSVSSASEGASCLPPQPSLPLPAPQRVCFAQNRTVHNPGITFSTPEPLCGQATRKAMMDAVTFEKDMVTCEKCQALLAGEGPKNGVVGMNSPPLTAASPTAVRSVPLLSPAVDPLKALMDRLDVPMLKKRQLELEGELAAVKVLLDAAVARAEARGE